MGGILIKKVLYKGDNYVFESPELGPGLNIIEGPNGTGKSTFVNLIYFALGGQVDEFSRNNKEKHTEIISDKNNYVEVNLLLNDSQYLLKRFINSNDITIFSEDGDVNVLPIFRSKNEKVIFSDWILEKLNIAIVEVFQGVKNFKINFKDLMRLIFHNQELNPKKIYKPSDSDNDVSDSETVRKIIFELLVGKTFSDYYAALAKFKEAEKDRNLAKAIHDEYLNIAKSLSENSDDLNLNFLLKEKEEREIQLSKLYSTRGIIKNNRPLSVTTLSNLDQLRLALLQIETKLAEKQEEKRSITEEKIKLNRLKESLILETTQIKKIIHSHEKLNLFSADTCPYCLRNVNRTKGHCVCGSEIDESQYERFFYSSDEYLDILKSKQKSVDTVNQALTSCVEDIGILDQDIQVLVNESQSLKNSIRETVLNVDGGVDINSLNKIDDKILEIREEINKLTQRIEVEKKLEVLQEEFNGSVSRLEELRNRVRLLQTQANQEINAKVNDFNVIYDKLMKETLSNCRSAKISYEDYMPIINDGDYREASSTVPIRLMYYLSLLYLSVSNSEVKFPHFLLIDTPETAGVDEENLINCISQIEKIEEKAIECHSSYQILFSTGVNKYPSKYKGNVKIKLSKQNRLLKPSNENK